MAVQLPCVETQGRPRRVLIYQPSDQSCTSTELDTQSGEEPTTAATPATPAAAATPATPAAASRGEGGLGGGRGGQQHGAVGRSRSPVAMAERSRPLVIRVVSPGRLPVLPLLADRVEDVRVFGSQGSEGHDAQPGLGHHHQQQRGVGVSRGHEVEMTGTQLEEEIGTQLMNGSASNIVEDLTADDPIVQILTADSANSANSVRVSRGQGVEMSSTAWVSSVAARLPDTATVAGGFSAMLVAQAFRHAIAPLPAPLLELTFDGWETIEELVRQGVRESRRRIRDVVRDGQAFYIGITENPVRRWAEHQLPGHHTWDTMEILVKAPSSAVTGPIEKDLIEEFRGHFLCHNVGRGGEHASAGMPHFAYLLVGPALLRRSTRRSE